MLINLSDFPSSDWTARQRENAKAAYGVIQDLPFPSVNPAWKEEQVLEVAMEYVTRCLDLLPPQKNQSAVLISGESTFTVTFVSRMHQEGVPCIAATSEPYTETLRGGGEKVHYRFVRFRRYLL